MSEKEDTDFGLEWLLLEAVKFCPIEELKAEKNYPLSFSMTTTQKEEENIPDEDMGQLVDLPPPALEEKPIDADHLAEKERKVEKG